MKTIFERLIFTLVLGLLLVSINLKADSASQSAVWSQHPEMLTSTIVLKDHAESITITNTSSSLLKIVTQGSESFVRIYCAGANGNLIAIGEHRFYNDHRDDAENGPLSIEIQPKEQYSQKIGITSGERELIRSNQVVCHIIAYDPVSKNTYTIESSPKLLVKDAVNK